MGVDHDEAPGRMEALEGRPELGHRLKLQPPHGYRRDTALCRGFELVCDRGRQKEGSQRCNLLGDRSRGFPVFEPVNRQCIVGGAISGPRVRRKRPWARKSSGKSALRAETGDVFFVGEHE